VAPTKPYVLVPGGRPTDELFVGPQVERSFRGARGQQGLAQETQAAFHQHIAGGSAVRSVNEASLLELSKTYVSEGSGGNRLHADFLRTRRPWTFSHSSTIPPFGGYPSN